MPVNDLKSFNFGDNLRMKATKEQVIDKPMIINLFVSNIQEI
jgi:hypothetical protein